MRVQVITEDGMKVYVTNAHTAEGEVMKEALARCNRFADQADSAEIFVQPRVPADAPAYQHPGWLEYTLRISFNSGCVLDIGCIQRKPGEPVEFHS